MAAHYYGVIITLTYINYLLSALTLLIVCQEGHLTCKEILWFHLCKTYIVIVCSILLVRELCAGQLVSPLSSCVSTVNVYCETA